MKFTAYTLNGYLSKPNPAIKAFLVYGVDNGLIKETATKIAQLIVPDLNDSFCAISFDASELKTNPTLLYDEASAYSLMGGRKVIRVSESDDSVLDQLTFFIEKYNGDNFVVLSAGNLAKTSKLRKFAEDSPRVGTFACYNDNNVSLRQVIQEELVNNKMMASNDVISYLTDNLGADRAIARSELTKLFTYMGENQKISLEDVKAVIGDGSVISVDDAIYAMAEGNFKALDKALAKVFKENEEVGVQITRAALNHFQRVSLVKAKKYEGQSFEIALRGLYPPVHFTKTASFERQCEALTSAVCERILRYLVETEIACKTTGNVVQTVVSYAALNICRICKKYMA